uniref:hypothetical protein n=1 Tax=Microcoleus sp. OTE_8_concoct_300 TaxID=2964710 RepID=UPI00403F4B89
MRDGVMQTISASGGGKHIYVDIEGSWISDRQPIKQQFWVIKQEGNEFVIADSKGIYKTGVMGQIATNRLVPKPGEAAQYQIIGVDFGEEEINPKLQQLIQPNSLIFLSGTLTIDSPEEVKLSLNPKQLQTITIVGNTIQIESCPIQWAMHKLNYQFGSGSLKVQIVSPPPKL